MIGLNKKQIQIMPKNILGIERTSSKEELAKWYSASKVFVNLSLEDTYPTVNIEAMACGTPVIGYRTGGMVEQIAKCGYLVNKYDLNEVAKIINTTEFEKIDYEFENNMVKKYIEVYKLVELKND